MVNTLEDVTNMPMSPPMVGCPPPPPPASPPAAPPAPVVEEPVEAQAPAAPPTATLLSKVCDALPKTREKRQLVGVVAANVTIITFYFANLSLVAPLCMVTLIAIMASGIRLMLSSTPPSPLEPLTVADIEAFVPHVVDGINAARSLVSDVLLGRNSRQALCVAIGCYIGARASAVLSAPMLALLAVDAVLAWHMASEYEPAQQKLRELLESEQVKKGTELLSRLNNDLKWLGGTALVGIWSFCFSFWHKVLTIGFIILALNASGKASQPAVQQSVQVFKKHARRVSMSAGDLLMKVRTPSKAKAM